METHDEFALFVAHEERKKRRLELDDLLLLRSFVLTASLDRWSAAEVLQLREEEAAAKLIRLREKEYLVVRGRGRGASYELRQDLAERFRDRPAVNAGVLLEEEGVRLRILALLRQRGRLNNSEIRRFSGFSRVQVYRLIKQLEKGGEIRFVGKGRGAHIVPAKEK